MFSTTQPTNAAHSRLAETHARQMFLYYYLRALLETPGVVADAERAVTHWAAVEARRFGFRIESQAEPLGLRLGDYDEENFRREAYRAAHLHPTDPVQALEIEGRLITETVSFALSAGVGEAERALAA